MILRVAGLGDEVPVCVCLKEQDIHLFARTSDTLPPGLSYSLISFLSFYCLFSRFDRYQRDGGSSDFGAYVVSLGEVIIEAMSDRDFEGLRLRRMSGPERAAAAKREQAEAFNRMVQGHKLASSSVSSIGYQVLFPTSTRNVISFFQSDDPGEEARKWSNFDPNSKVLPAHTVRIL